MENVINSNIDSTVKDISPVEFYSMLPKPTSGKTLDEMVTLERNRSSLYNKLSMRKNSPAVISFYNH
jgi:hypothetical protein